MSGHSKWATIFSQAGRAIKPLGTTHADTFYGEIPVTRRLTPSFSIEKALIMINQGLFRSIYFFPLIPLKLFQQ